MTDNRLNSTKRAKVVTKAQFPQLLQIVKRSEHALRDEVALRLSYFAGLRACEIAGLRWDNNVLDAEGNVMESLHITGDIAKRSIERMIPIETELGKLLKRLHDARPEDVYVFYALHNNIIPMVPKLNAKGEPVLLSDGSVFKVPRPGWKPGRVGPNAVVQWFKRLYADAKFRGCTSHSGRRTFVTARARLANLKQCSLEDVRILAGHASLATTQTYIEPSNQQRELVNAW